MVLFKDPLNAVSGEQSVVLAWNRNLVKVLNGSLKVQVNGSMMAGKILGVRTFSSGQLRRKTRATRIRA